MEGLCAKLSISDFETDGEEDGNELFGEQTIEVSTLSMIYEENAEFPMTWLA